MAAANLYTKDLYRVLGVSKSDDVAAVKSAYRKLAKELHPDKTKGDKKLEARFKDVSSAYEILSDPVKRSEYDSRRSELLQSKARGGGTKSGSSHTNMRGSGNDASYPNSRYPFDGSEDDVFSTFFGGSGPARGADLQGSIEVSLRESITGKSIKLSANGQIISTRVPAGVRDGTKIRIKGIGLGGDGGAGDLIVRISVRPHPVFSRTGNDLTMVIPVTMVEAALGSDIVVPTIDGGEVKFKLPAGTQSGKVLRIRGLGISGGSPGDLLIQVSVKVPDKLDAKARVALEEYAKTCKEWNPRSGLAELVSSEG